MCAIADQQAQSMRVDALSCLSHDGGVGAQALPAQSDEATESSDCHADITYAPVIRPGSDIICCQGCHVL